MLRDKINELLKKKKQVEEISQEQIEKERKKEELRKTDDYKRYMKQYDVASLKSIIIYNYPLATDPFHTSRMTEETINEIKQIIDVAQVALDDISSQVRQLEEYNAYLEYDLPELKEIITSNFGLLNPENTSKWNEEELFRQKQLIAAAKLAYDDKKMGFLKETNTSAKKR